jgi:hypothetical protein
MNKLHWLYILQIVFLYSTLSNAQIVLEYRHDSIIIDTALPGDSLYPGQTITFSNKKEGMINVYSDEMKHLGIQFRNKKTNYMCNNVYLATEKDSMCNHKEKGCFSRIWHSSPILGVGGNGTKVIYCGRLFKGDNTYSKTSLAVYDSGHFVFSRHSNIDLVFPRYGNYTRQIWAFGDGSGTIELEEGLIANRSKMGTTNESFGSIRLNNINFITHNSEAIPHYMMADNNNPNHVLRNAHLVFEGNPGSKWVISTNPQEYAGGLQVYTKCAIDAKKHLLLNGNVSHWPEKGYYDYGGIVFYHENLSLTISGKGGITFNCDMGFSPGSEMIVNNSRITFKKDPFNEKASMPSSIQNGQHLSIILEGRSELTIITDTVRLEKLIISENSSIYIKADAHLFARHAILNGNCFIYYKNQEKPAQHYIHFTETKGRFRYIDYIPGMEK